MKIIFNFLLLTSARSDRSIIKVNNLSRIKKLWVLPLIVQIFMAIGANGECTNPTFAGTIAGDQFFCTSGDPVAFTSTEAATGHTGTLEYKWQSSTTSNLDGFSDIASSNNEVYDAPSVTQTTWYRRLARVDCQANWIGAVESNVVEVTVPALPTVSNIDLSPDLDITHFANYTLSANVDPNGSTINDVSFIVRPQTASADNSNWDFLTNGTPKPNPNVPLVEKATNTSGNAWSFGQLRPDNIYSEIAFIFDITAAPTNSRFWQNSYQLMRFNNNYEITANTNFFIEVNATPNSGSPPSVDMQVYLVGNGFDISAFQTDGSLANEAWQNHASVELVGTINKDELFHHSHGPNSSHFMVPLSADANGKIGNKDLDISGDFWIILTTGHQLQTRGWDMKYHAGCDNNGTWYKGSGTNFSLQSGCPDVHVHFARKEATPAYNTMEVKVAVEYEYNGQTCQLESASEIYSFAPLPNLPPNASAFIAPAPGTYQNDVTISWYPATDPNNDPITYKVYLKKGAEQPSLVATGLTATTYTLNTKLYPNDDYDILVEACDAEFCTSFMWSSNIDEGGFFRIKNLVAGAITTGNDQTICYGTTPSPISATEPTDGSGIYEYQWQEWNGTAWVNVATGTGAATLTYSPPALTKTTKYRLQQTDTSFDLSQTVETAEVVVMVLEESDPCAALTFRLANPILEKISLDNFLTFDVLVKTNVASFLWSGQVSINFNDLAFSTSTEGWTISKGVLLSGDIHVSQPKYNLLLPVSLSDNTMTIGFNANGISDDQPPGTEYFNEVTVDFVKILTIKVKITGSDKEAGLSFNPANMEGMEWRYKKDATTVFGQYTTPNTYDNSFFTIMYLERFHTLSGWQQIEGGTTPDWSVAKKTSILEGDITIPTGQYWNASALRIHDNGTVTVTVQPGSTLTVNGELDILSDRGLLIQSDNTGTGSVITGSATTNGKAIAERYMTTGAWHFVSSPFSGQSIAGFLANNTNIPLKDGKRGMMNYIPGENKWSDFFTNDKEGNLLPGAGYAVRIDDLLTPGEAVEFSGTITTGPITLSALVANSWNLVGNPYTSGLRINNGTEGTNFLTTNLDNLDQSYAAVYLWDQLDENNGVKGKYSFISNANVSLIPGAQKLTQGYVQPGQGFLVKMNSATSLNYTTAMQAHVNNTEAPFKSAKIWPAIALDVKSGQHSSAAYIGFNNRMTPGLDPSYDVGAYRGDADLLLYSRLIEDNGVNFALQCLPANNSETWIIPLGIDSKSGGEITFSASSIGLHASSTVILEDRLNNVFTPLKTPGSFYRANLEANSSSVGRFFLHTSYQTTSIDDDLAAQELKAYMVRNEIVIDGRVSSKAVAMLYDVQGRSIMARNLKEGFRNTMSAQGLKTGFYLLQVIDNGQQNTFKIPVVAQ